MAVPASSSSAPAPAAPAPTSDARRKLLWAGVYQQLLRHALPDSRFHYDFLKFAPDFRRSSEAVARVAELPCYRDATTLLVTADNSLERLRHRALRDGKRLLVATHRLRRGFVLLDPRTIAESRLELAACLDGMEKPGIGRAMELAQLRDARYHVDMCALGGLVFNEQGVVVWEGSALFEVQWALLHDLGLLDPAAPVVAVAHDCQVVDEAQHALDAIKPDKHGEVQCDFVATPDRLLQIHSPAKPTTAIDFSKVDPDALNNIPPLQELKGIRLMQHIMSAQRFATTEEPKEKPKQETPKAPSAEEQMGIDIVERLMKGLKS